MDYSQGTKRKTPPKTKRKSIGVQSILAQVRYFLCFTSEHPLEDADRINKLVDKCRAAHAKKSPSPSPKTLPPSIKDETMQRLKKVLTAAGGARFPELDKLLIAVVDKPEVWLKTPSIQFGGRCPGDLVGTKEEHKLIDILRAVDQGIF